MDSTEEAKRAARIRRLNDEFRTRLEGGVLILTFAVQAFSGVGAVVELVRLYDCFNEDNDPYGEHDFGAFVFRGRHFFWKIDYYDNETLSFGSEDPADPERTTRALTIMFADEY